MASEVTKRIKGREYRYVVDWYRDPETKRRKQRWRYIGVVDNGKVRAGGVLKPRKPTTHDEIVAATARLLEFRAPKHITVSVIAASAGASRSAFYRHFSSAKEAITEAFARIVNEAFLALPSLGAPRTLQEARVQLRAWCEAFNHSVGLDHTCKRALLHGYRGRVRARLKAALSSGKAPAEILAAFFKRLNDAGLTAIEDPDALAEAVTGLHGALRLSKLVIMPGEEPPVREYAEFYALIERAVFGALQPGRLTVRER